MSTGTSTSLYEHDARLAYAAYAHRAGELTPWERLTNAQQQGWREAIEAVLEDQEEGLCPDCGDELTCIACEVTAIATALEESIAKSIAKDKKAARKKTKTLSVIAGGRQ